MVKEIILMIYEKEEQTFVTLRFIKQNMRTSFFSCVSFPISIE